MKDANVMNIYGCGGAGINIASKYVPHTGMKNPGFTTMVPYFIDTSRSNIKDGVKDESIYLMDGLDGSGKKRDSNYTAIKERSKEILHKFKPADINIVIHSASGGSGSVIGPILASEMSDRSPTIVILIGSSDSRIETDNTIKTLKGYEVIAQKKSHPIAVVYYENSNTSGRGKIDQEILVDLSLLSMIFSGDNAELDSADLHNFLNYNRVTTYDPGLTYLKFFSKEIELERDQHAASVVSLTDEENDAALNVLVEYQAVGFASKAATDALHSDGGQKLPIHAAMVIGYFHPKIDALEKKLAQFDSHRGTVVQKSLVSKETHDQANSDGLIF